MANYTEAQIQEALEEIEKLDHYTMCQYWRNGCAKSDLYFRNDLPTGKAFSDRLFKHFGGFNAQISKSIGWNG